MSTAAYHWMNWQPGQIISESPNPEPAKPAKPGFDGFDGSNLGHSQIFHRGKPAPVAPVDAPSGMTALQILAEVRAAGGWFRLVDSDLSCGLGAASAERLEPAIRQRKADLLALLAKPDGACPAGHPGNYWQDGVGQWHCADCEPGPAQRRMRGVDLAVLGNRAISLVPPAADLPARGSWAKAPDGAVCELVLFRADGCEVLTRALKGERLAWYAPEGLHWEVDWPWA